MRYLVFTLTLFQLHTVFAQTPAQNQQVIETENARFQAMIRRDTAALRGMLADDLVYIHSNALLESKTTHLEAIAARTISYNIMSREGEPAVRWLDKCTAITNGIIRVSGLLGTDPFTVKLRYTAIYQASDPKKPMLLKNWQSTRMVE